MIVFARGIERIEYISRKWWTALSDGAEWPIPGEPDTHDEWRELND